MTELGSTFERLSPTKVLVCSDIRVSRALPHEQAELAIRSFKAHDPALLAGGFLFAAEGSMGLQLLRVASEAGSNRFASSSRDEILAWFKELTTPEELVEIREWLAPEPSEPSVEFSLPAGIG
ncbi:MAG: hypothetical protein MPN21_16845 [Thermoanaerobaculia bacterium]|nr:hypothetical protein [Thermoanaerobaculia bacterium]